MNDAWCRSARQHHRPTCCRRRPKAPQLRCKRHYTHRQALRCDATCAPLPHALASPVPGRPLGLAPYQNACASWQSRSAADAFISGADWARHWWGSLSAAVHSTLGNIAVGCSLWDGIPLAALVEFAQPGTSQPAASVRSTPKRLQDSCAMLHFRRAHRVVAVGAGSC